MSTSASFVLLLFFARLGVGLRRMTGGTDRMPVKPTSNTPEFPAQANCLIKYGYGLDKQCEYPTAFLPIPECESATFDEACEFTSSAQTFTMYQRDIRSSRSVSDLANTIVEGEGGGFGVTVSASLKYLKDSQVSEKSLAFFTGKAGRAQQKMIQQPTALKLNQGAKDLLRQNPQAFIKRYGLRYIHGMSFGGSFIGSVVLSSRQTSSTTEIDVFANLSVSKGLFSVDGSGQFQRMLRSASSDVECLINLNVAGGKNLTANVSSPLGLANALAEWEASWSTAPIPLTVTTRNWIDSAEVQEIANSMSDADRALFSAPPITAAITKEISKEDAAIAVMRTSVNKALGWEETQANPDAVTCFNGLSRNVTAMQIIIEKLVEPEIVAVQEQWLGGNYTWFRSGEFQQEFQRCEELLHPPTPVPTPAPTPAPTPGHAWGCGVKPDVWLVAEDFDKAQNAWPNRGEAGGQIDSVVKAGQVTSVAASGHGANAKITALTGGTATSLSLSNVVKDSSSAICTLSRYNGNTRGRIFNGGTNWLWGHHSGNAGVAHTQRWLTKDGHVIQPVDDWVVMCGHGSIILANGKSVGNGQSFQRPHGGDIYVNYGRWFHHQKSDFAIAEIMIWNSKSPDLEAASQYLLDLLAKGRKTQSNDKM